MISKTNQIPRFFHLFKDLSHGSTTGLLLWLHPSSGHDPLVRVPTAADQQNLLGKTTSLENADLFCVTVQ